MKHCKEERTEDVLGNLEAVTQQNGEKKSIKLQFLKDSFWMSLITSAPGLGLCLASAGKSSSLWDLDACGWRLWRKKNNGREDSRLARDSDGEVES